MIRLFTPLSLALDAELSLNDAQVHYLFHVMRMKESERILLFNGMDGEWEAELVALKKNKGTAVCRTQTRLQTEEEDTDAWLCFAPIKKTEIIVQKATELGVSVLCPVITKHTVMPRVHTDKIFMQAVEAAEQSERLSVPKIMEPVTLDALLCSWDKKRMLYYLHERENGECLTTKNTSVAFLVGPEGGFSPDEFKKLESFGATPLHLGRRILRAETACIAILANWNFILESKKDCNTP